MTESRKVILEKLGKNHDIVKIKFTNNVISKLTTAYLTAAFNKCFQNNFYKIILDMTHIDLPSHNFIATLIEATAKVRTKNGDVKIINMSEQAEQALATFSAYSYLSVPKEGDN
jgi:hypothetical protein